MGKRFRTEIGWVSYIVLNGFLAFGCLFFFEMSRRGVSEGALIAARILSGFGIFILLAMLLELLIPPFIQYEISEAELCLHPGFWVRFWHPAFQPRILFKSIQSVVPSSQGIGMYGCSMRGLQVNYLREGRKPRFVRISPKNRNDFLRELERRCPHLVLSEGRLVPPSVPKYIS